MKRIAKSLIALVCSTAVCAQVALSKEAEFAVENAISMAKALPHESAGAGYVEYYLDEPMAEVVRAQYLTADGKQIARKRLDYTGGAALPTFSMLDYRSSGGYRVIPHNGKLLVHTLRLLENGIQAVTDVREITVSEPVVIDAGFHRFLMDNWQAVANGQSVKFNFLQVDKARLVPLVVRRAACARQDRFCVKVSLSNLVLRVLFPSVELTYDAKTKRLLSYSGLGPLPTKNGKALPVDLTYQYLQ